MGIEGKSQAEDIKMFNKFIAENFSDIGQEIALLVEAVGMPNK